MTKEFFRTEIDIFFDSDTQTYKRDVLNMHWRKPLPFSPWVEGGRDSIILANHPELQSLIEKATTLAVSIANKMGTQSGPEQ